MTRHALVVRGGWEGHVPAEATGLFIPGLTDSLNDVLATTTLAPTGGGPHALPVPMPVVWTRRWGAGRVFFSAIGHDLADLTHPTVYALTLRGLLWAGRAGSGGAGGGGQRPGRA
ncbi:ThuA domain-containing protein [Streptosporangium roseum]|uniref:ThuA domain-containing protein n=1 Tax=Streptosporangium roseum TaxID=2001 RepID=UPI0033202AC7